MRVVSFGNSICIWESFQPQHTKFNEFNNHLCWKIFKGRLLLVSMKLSFVVWMLRLISAACSLVVVLFESTLFVCGLSHCNYPSVIKVFIFKFFEL